MSPLDDYLCRTAVREWGLWIIIYVMGFCGGVVLTATRKIWKKEKPDGIKKQ